MGEARLVQELKSVLPKLKSIVDGECEEVKGIDIAAAVEVKIELLLYQDESKALDLPFVHGLNSHVTMLLVILVKSYPNLEYHLHLTTT